MLLSLKGHISWTVKDSRKNRNSLTLAIHNDSPQLLLTYIPVFKSTLFVSLTVGIESLCTPGAERSKMWKNLQKASNCRLDTLLSCQKIDFISIIYTIRNSRKPKWWWLQVWASYRVYRMHRPYWKAVTRQGHGSFTIVFWKEQVVRTSISKVPNGQTHLIHIFNWLAKLVVPTAAVCCQFGRGNKPGMIQFS